MPIPAAVQRAAHKSEEPGGSAEALCMSPPPSGPSLQKAFQFPCAHNNTLRPVNVDPPAVCPGNSPNALGEFPFPDATPRVAAPVLRPIRPPKEPATSGVVQSTASPCSK